MIIQHVYYLKFVISNYIIQHSLNTPNAGFATKYTYTS